MRECTHCGTNFEPKGIERICSDDCRKEKKAQHDASFARSRARKPEAEAIHHMKFLGNQPNNDAHILKQKHITSPDVTKMPFSFHDKQTKATVYFNSQEQKNRYIERKAAQPNSDPLRKGGRSNQF